MRIRKNLHPLKCCAKLQVNYLIHILKLSKLLQIPETRQTKKEERGNQTFQKINK